MSMPIAAADLLALLAAIPLAALGAGLLARDWA